MWNKISRTLTKLETYTDGTLKQNTANRKILRTAVGQIDRALKDSGYYVGLQKTVNTLPALDKLNNEYFDFILDTFTPDKIYLSDLQKATVAEMQTYLANEGLEVMLKQPLNQILNQNINSGASVNDMVNQVRQFIVGGRVEGKELEGTLLRYSQQITRDALANYSAAFQQAITSDTGMEFYKYVGGIIDRTRDFCHERVGKFFHREEVKSWASLSWQGKRRGTTSSTIFIYRGGYNCGHSLVPVDESAVPKSVKERAKNKGYFKEAA